MSALRSIVAWLVLFAPVWTPVLGQTLPIAVEPASNHRLSAIGARGHADGKDTTAGGADKARDAADKSGASAGLPVVVGASGNASSTTRSAISGGSVVIHDEAAQQDLTGMTAAQTVAALNRDTSSDTLNALKPIFDKEKIEAGFEIASEAQKQVGQFLETRARQAKALEDALKNEPEGPRRDQLKQAFEDAKTWGPGGESRRWLTAILGAVSGNVTGAAGDAIQATAVNYLQGLAASDVKQIVSALGDGPMAETARAAMHAIVGCAGAAGKGSDCGAGALGAGSGAVLNALLAGDASKMTPEEKELRRNLIGSLVAGIAEASGVSGAEAVFAAINETENNALSVPEHQARIQEKAQCKFDTQCERRVAKKYKEIDDRNRKALAQCASVEVCRAEIDAATARLGEYNSRIANLEEKLRSDGGLSASEWDEWSILKISASVMLDTDRNAAIKNYLLLGGDQAKQLVWDEIAKAGVAGAAAAVGAVGSRTRSALGGAKDVPTNTTPAKTIAVDNKGNALIGDWSTTKNLTAPENALAHWNKHSSEFPEYSNASQYVGGAQSFVSKPPANVLTKTRTNGDTLFYDQATNTFAVKAADGAPRTMFRPDPKQHGYSTNLDYFNAQ
ncbi:hypothetical protein A7P25_05545 [Achromobacter xylosoxidans]|nr:hypothetical protein A7P25_05545 [Achromobacter xylosoxidans]